MNKHKSDRKCWYDGYVYEKLVGPQEAEGNAVLKDLIEKDSTVLDIGCGPGLFAFSLTDRCKSVTGIDLSSRMIRYANKIKVKNQYENIHFIHHDASRISEVINEHFDYTVLALFLHETESETREKSARQASSFATKIIISDFLSPIPKNFYTRLLIGQELLIGGINHYRNFKSWITLGGIDGFVERMGWEIEQTIPWPGKNRGVGKFLVCLSEHEQ